MIVIDATVLLDFFIGTEVRKASAELLLAEDSTWISPSLWRYELGNALRTSVRSKDSLLDAPTALQHMRNAERLISQTWEHLDGPQVLDLAIQRGLTVYDASYVWVAKEHGIKLRTRDAEVLQSCPEVALPMPVCGA